MQRRLLRTRVTLALIVGLAVAAGDVAGARGSMTAMACCAKTHGDCAGVKAPDDCCRGMGHVVAGPTSNTPPTQPRLDYPVLHAILAWTTIHSPAASAPLFVAVNFKRPHDPPHLHAFALLI